MARRGNVQGFVADYYRSLTGELEEAQQRRAVVEAKLLDLQIEQQMILQRKAAAEYALESDDLDVKRAYIVEEYGEGALASLEAAMQVGEGMHRLARFGSVLDEWGAFLEDISRSLAEEVQARSLQREVTEAMERRSVDRIAGGVLDEEFADANRGRLSRP